MKVCAIVGGGQIGSRHLQAVASLKMPVKAIVVDPSAESLQRAEQMFDEAVAGGSEISADFVNHIEDLPRDIDLAILATNARHRLPALERLLQRCSVRSIIFEKFLFQSLCSYERATELLQQRSVQAWVNCPRRLWPLYGQIEQRLNGAKLQYRVTGSDWGLGCNGIHFIDHLAFLTGDTKYSIDDAELALASTSKREGFIEFTGTLRGKTSRGSEFEITSFDYPGAPIELSIVGGGAEYRINETERKGWATDKGHNGDRLDMHFDIPYVSQTSRIACEDIFSGSECGLCSYEESAALHLPLLRTFLKAFNAQLDEATLVCPIT